MTEQFEDVARESPRASKVLVGLFSALIGFVVLGLGWQQWVYTQQREDVSKQISQSHQDVKDIAARQDALISALTNRQDILRQRHEQLAEANSQQDVRIAKEYVTLERYSCDVAEIKKSLDKGISRIEAQIDNLQRRR
jgi:C4-dicarboxylate-specific signal transduction histidine kinase